MADLIDISLDNNANINSNISKKLKTIAASALEDSFKNKAESDVTNAQKEIFNSIKKKLFLKYIMTDYEFILTGIHRNDKLSSRK